MKVRSFLIRLASGLALVGMSGVAHAQIVAQTQNLGPAGTFNIPLGVAIPDSAPGIQMPRPRIPIGEDELARIKKLPGPRDDSQPVPQRNAPAPEAFLTNCVTNDATGFTPSDIHGAAGPTNIVVVTNVDIGIFNKSNCAVVSRVGLRVFFGATFTIPSTQTLFDPQVLFDPAVGRFFVAVESDDSTNTDQFQYFAVSTDSSGTSWFQYRVVLSQGAAFFCKPSAGHFWDYPHPGWVNGANPRWFFTANIFLSNTFTGNSLVSIAKTPTLTGAATSAGCVSQSLAGNTAPTLVQDGSNTAFLLSSGSGGGSSLTRYSFTTSASPATDTVVTTAAIAITVWSGPPAAAQPNGTTLDTLDGRFQSATIQNGTNLWNVHSINIGGFARWRLYQLSTTGTSPLFTFNTTSVAGNNDHLFNPSVATNATQAFISSSRTVPSDSSGAGNAAMLIFNGANASSAGWTFDLIATSASQYTGCSVCRWGDNSATQIDPSNDAAAWGFNQLVTGTSQFFNWTTRGALVTASAAPPPPAACGGKAKLGDFNADGCADLLFRRTNGQVLEFLMNGSSIISAPIVAQLGTDWQNVGIGDFNGDGKADILFRRTNGTVLMFLMNGGQVQSAIIVAQLGTDWQNAGVGDLNGDGTADIVFRRTNGQVLVFLMSGAQVLSAPLIGQLGSDWVSVFN